MTMCIQPLVPVYLYIVSCGFVLKSGLKNRHTTEDEEIERLLEGLIDGWALDDDGRNNDNAELQNDHVLWPT